MATGFGIALHDAGLPVGPDRCERLARAVTIMGATTVAELRACALATMVSDPGQMPTFDRVFAAVFGGPSPFRHLNLPTTPRSYERPESDGSPQPQGRSEEPTESAGSAEPYQPHSSTELIEAQQGRTADAPLCLTCGTKMRPAGSCYVCEGCGSTSGCS